MTEPANEYYEPYLSIGTAARMLGISVFTLRMYEREGIFIPYKADSHQRRYSQADIDRLKCIRKAINEYKMSIQGIKRVQALIPCWQIIGCSEEDRANCEAYKSPKGGCWTYQHVNNTCATRDCRLCEVYRVAVDCERIKETIIQVTNKSISEIEQ
ncbi:MAG: MerR family transcriptional regulator [Ignavibacteriales bacterium]|nr:MerR family transcriptional regulator [Ignavibacteriales bacterium]